MATVPFTRYYAPNGRKGAVMIDRPDNIAQAADKIREHGFKFECEILSNGLVSLTIHDPKIEEDVGIEVCENGKDVTDAVDRLISKFDLGAAIKRRGTATAP